MGSWLGELVKNIVHRHVQFIKLVFGIIVEIGSSLGQIYSFAGLWLREKSGHVLALIILED